ncbi:hypothetical protein DUNSADRAFT_14736 [Dunaliella salina]|uniref:RING-type domain-containing protein n=1 Tax=Dunaliella salina TaxID=3046 RepID=A0ABQ7H2E4_DUNSA|nr:hypothetical protein DUNSADRAFT_14736 [Dunaliella salina]|eukprot:KAF5841029.1 hypothetical protein DUNSADRAFT_14736 [Dunaliella salina]
MDDEQDWLGRVSCCVCLDTRNAKDTSWVALECGHVFHMECLAQALEHQRTCPTCRKRSRREPLRLFVNNERCDPSDSGAGVQLSDAGQELHLERRKFTEKLEEHRRGAAHIRQELEETQKELQEKIKKLDHLKAKYSGLKLQHELDEDRWRQAEKRTAAKEEEVIKTLEKVKSLSLKMKEMEEDHSRQLLAKESEVVRLKNEKKRGIWSSNQKLTYEQILEMSNTSEERDSLDDMAKVLAQRNVELQVLKAQLTSLEGAKQQLEEDAALREAELKRDLQAQVAQAMKQWNGERLQVNRLESELGIVQGQLNEAKEQLESQVSRVLEQTVSQVGKC